MNAEISETIRARLLVLGMQIPRTVAPTVLVLFILTEMYCSHQHQSIDPKKSLPRPQTASIHAHSNAHKPTKPVAPTILMLDKKI